MKAYADLSDLPEDERIRIAAETAANGSIVGVPMTSINSKLGMKPRTRKRVATHGSALAGGLRCPSCGTSHVMRTQSSNGQQTADYWCAYGHFFDAPATTEVR